MRRRQPLAQAEADRVASTETARPRSAAIEAYRDAKDRDEFVKLRFLHAAVSDQRDRQIFGVGATVLITAICWAHAPRLPLLAWFFARVLLLVARLGLASFARARAQPSAQLDAIRWSTVLAALSGVVLGLSVLLFLGRAPISSQFICWLILAGAIALPIRSMALDLPRLHAFLGSFFMAVLGCVAYRVLRGDSQLAADVLRGHYEAWFISLPIFAWLIAHYVANRSHAWVRQKFEADYRIGELITDLEAAKRQAEEAVKTKNRFLATAAHDMRQPVMALSIYADQLLEATEEKALITPKIAKAAAAINRLFDSLFDLARIDNHQMTLRSERINVAEVMQDLFDQYACVAEAKGIRLKMRTCDAEIVTDPVRLRQMVGNLISNAIKYTPSGKKVLITSRTRSDGVRVEIWDQGIGIPQDELKKIFLEFYKARNCPSATDGFGLGLAIVARLAHALHAPVCVRSRSGCGSVFRVLVAKPSVQ